MQEQICSLGYLSLAILPAHFPDTLGSFFPSYETAASADLYLLRSLDRSDLTGSRTKDICSGHRRGSCDTCR